MSCDIEVQATAIMICVVRYYLKTIT